MGDLEERVLRLETTVKLMQTQLEAINKNIFGEPERNVQSKNHSVFADPGAEEIGYSNEPSPFEGQGEGQGVDEGAEEILGDIGEPLGHPRVEAPEQIELKPPQSFEYFNLKACQVVLTRIPPEELIKYEPPPEPMPCSSKKRVILSKEDYSKAKSYNIKATDLPLLCGHCPQSIKYTSNSHLLTHLSSEHSNISSQIISQIHKCKFCLRCFKSEEELVAHLASDEVEGLYSCPDCSFQNSRIAFLIIHWSKVHDRSTELICAYCSRVTYNSRELWDHFRNKHPDGGRFKKKSYKCPLPQCGLTLTAKKSINRHIEFKHPDHLHLRLTYTSGKDGSKPSRKPNDFQAKKNAEYSRNLTSRTNNSDGSSPNLYKINPCPVPDCGLSFTAKQSVNRHIRSKHPDHLHLQLLSNPVAKLQPPSKRSNKKYTRGSFMCHICSKVFPFEHYLGTHLKTHSEDRPRLICEKCGASYLNKQDLTTHIREKHDGTLSRGDKLCPICGVTTKWISFSAHMRRHRSPIHKCPFCPAKFTIASLLRIHRSTHTGELAVDCSICGKTCSNKERLKIHMTLHKDSWDFTCKAEGCSRKFKNTAQMNDHFRLRHKKKVVQVEEN